MKPYDRQRTRLLHTGSKAWQTIRAQILAWEPLCRHCNEQGRLTVATEVDHIDGDSHNNDMDNLQSLCRDHHAVKSAREGAGLSGEWGCDAQGFPLDPNHPWNREEPPRHGTRPSLSFIANGEDE